ncbi:MAG: PEGA domain-containing protein [Vicinamibacterales bacterium]
MSVLSESTPENRPGGKGPLIIGLLVVIALIAAVVLFRSTEAPPTGTVSVAPAPEATPERPATPAPRRAAPRTAEPAPAPAPAATTRARLRVTTDVAGASVFVNRKFVGTTPLTLDDLAPGETTFNLSAEGFDPVDRTVSLTAGDNDLAVRFKEVRLNERIPVVHKHRFGSCDGMLVATLDGLRYETSNTDDAFSLPYDRVETFEVNYLDKNLRVKERGGKTWNFTDKNDNADNLFVFHKKVEEARDKLAKGYAPVK